MLVAAGRGEVLMNRWAVILGCALCLSGVGCAGDDSDGSGGNAGSGAGAGGVGASGGVGGTSSGHGGSGTGGTSATGGGSGTGGTGSTAGAGGAGAGAGGSGTGGASGESGAGGSTAGAGGSSGPSCGGRGQAECEDGFYCDFPPEADCGRFDAPGSCVALTDSLCTRDYVPVCGCDGMTYANSCTAHGAGMSIDYDGECGAEPTGKHQCVPSGGVACLIAPPGCLEGEVPSYDGDVCGSTCVPIETCDCAGPEDCPFEDMYTCHLSAGHCGPYVN